jgi:hypothetical protein
MTVGRSFGRALFVALVLLLLGAAAIAQPVRSGHVSKGPVNDPYLIVPFKAVPMLSAPYSKTQVDCHFTGSKLVIIIPGQSNAQNVAPTGYVPTNSGHVYNFNVFDGGCYAAVDPLLGTAYVSLNSSTGNFAGRLADTFINNGVVANVVLAPIAVGGSSVADWDTGQLSNRIAQTISRLAVAGLTPDGILWAQGEDDCSNGTSQAAYAASLSSLITRIQGLTSARWFVRKESWVAGVTCAAVTNAQASVVSHPGIWQAADADSLGAGDRQADNIHFNDTGMIDVTALDYAAMHASGSPF